VPNQPKPAPGTRGHYLSKIPDELWTAVKTAAFESGESVSAYTCRLWLEDLERRASEPYTYQEWDVSTGTAVPL
jgi:hypothetical protein